MRDVVGQNGRTLLANTSTVVGQDGTFAGRVVVLRDITVLKELDSLKTVSAGEADLMPETLTFLEGLTDPMHIQVCVTPT